MKSPLQVITLDDYRPGDLAVATPLEFGADIDQHGAVPHGSVRVDGCHALERGASLGEISVE